MRIDKAIIYETLNPEAATPLVRESRSGRQAIVGLTHVEDLPSAAKKLADQGYRLIELCGGISPAWRSKVATAVGDKALVSSATFGIESLLSAASYNANFLAGRPQREAFIIVGADADPARDRITRLSEGQNTTFVYVPDDATGARVAAELCEEGVALIELYGGFTTEGIAAVIEAVDGRAPVGAGSFALDALGSPSLNAAA